MYRMSSAVLKACARCDSSIVVGVGILYVAYIAAGYVMHVHVVHVYVAAGYVAWKDGWVLRVLSVKVLEKMKNTSDNYII